MFSASRKCEYTNNKIRRKKLSHFWLECISTDLRPTCEIHLIPSLLPSCAISSNETSRKTHIFMITFHSTCAHEAHSHSYASFTFVFHARRREQCSFPYLSNENCGELLLHISCLTVRAFLSLCVFFGLAAVDDID